MITLQAVSLIRGDKTLLDNVSLTIYAKQKIGLVGRNGCGKSSLLALLLQELDPSLGDVSLQKNCAIAHIAQETPAVDDSALDYVLQAHHELWAILAKLKQAQDNDDHELAASCHMQLDECRGYALQHEAAQLLQHLGFEEAKQSAAVKSFSGGWRMRLNLARALFAPSDILLLDEPTNHLDLETILWLEKWLKSTSKTTILISHDRDFLDGIVSHIAHIDQAKITLYSGNYSNFEKQYADNLALQQATFEKQQKKVKHMMRFVDRFRYKSSKAKQAQSRLKMIDKMETVAAVQQQSPISFEFLEPEPLSDPILTMKQAQAAYGETVILKDIEFRLSKGDRVALLGVNGAGKSTLIKAILNKLNVSGDIVMTPKLKIGYFAQHQLDEFDNSMTALAIMQQKFKNSTVQALRNFLGSFAFSGDMALTPVGRLSGGERARLALAILIWQRPSLLLLDEPTNHLDIEMRMALTFALQNYSGAMILVSHDRYLLETLCDTLWLVADHHVTEFDGSVADYQRWVLEQDKAPKEKKAKAKNKKPSINLDQLEKDIEKTNQKLEAIKADLFDTDLYQAGNEGKLEQLQKEQSRLTKLLSELEAKWLAAAD